MEDSNVIDRRSSIRVRLSEPVRYELINPSQFGGCLAVDISEGGIRVKLNEFVPLNAEVTLQIQLPNGTMVECIGVVMWTEKAPYMDQYFVGLDFLDVQSEVDFKHKIQRYVQSYQNYI